MVVLKLGVFVGLLIFLMVATIACDNTEPLLEPASIQESTGTSAPTPTPDGTDVSQSPSRHIDPASREAEGYAAHHGVSLEEAQNRFTLLWDVTPKQWTYANIWFCGVYSQSQIHDKGEMPAHTKLIA